MRNFPLDILEELQAIRRKEATAAVAKVNFDTAANGSSSQLVDSLIIRLADRENVAVPLTGSAEPKEGQITGGYVHDVDAGLHPWIAVLDFKSMYPSIMIGSNVCYTTRIDPIQSDQPAEDEPVPRSHRSSISAPKRSQRLGANPVREFDGATRCSQSGAQEAKQSEDSAGIMFHDSMQYAVKI